MNAQMTKILLGLLLPMSLYAQGWTEIGSLPSPPIEVNSNYSPVNATPFFRTWEKPVYDTNNQGLLVYMANPNCCSGTFSNAVFLYQASINKWTLVWSHNTSVGGSSGALADSIDAPADNHPYHALAWDSKRGVLWKAFGSAVKTQICGDCGVSDTYKLDTSTSEGFWTQVCGDVTNNCAPGPLQETAMAYDPIHDTIVLYGGLRKGSATADTWEFSPSTGQWTKICGLYAKPLPVCGPPELDAPGLVYDSALGQFVLFGGSENNSTWLYNVSTHTWKESATSGPPMSKFPVTDYIPRLNAVVMIAEDGSVWSFNGTWQNLDISKGPTLSGIAKNNAGAYDPSADRFILFLNSGKNGTIWSLDLP